MSLNFITAWRTINDTINRVLIWRFTLVLIKINYRQIGDQTGLFYTTNPVFYTSWNRFARLGIWLFHLSRRTTVIQDLLVRRQFSLVPDNRTNVNVEAWVDEYRVPQYNNQTLIWIEMVIYYKWRIREWSILKSNITPVLGEENFPLKIQFGIRRYLY
jgi:hypothetical protein